jgi:hypothetical protein
MTSNRGVSHRAFHAPRALGYTRLAGSTTTMWICCDRSAGSHYAHGHRFPNRRSVHLICRFGFTGGFALVALDCAFHRCMPFLLFRDQLLQRLPGGHAPRAVQLPFSYGKLVGGDVEDQETVSSRSVLLDVLLEARWVVDVNAVPRADGRLERMAVKNADDVVVLDGKVRAAGWIVRVFGRSCRSTFKAWPVPSRRTGACWPGTSTTNRATRTWVTRACRWSKRPSSGHAKPGWRSL